MNSASNATAGTGAAHAGHWGSPVVRKDRGPQWPAGFSPADADLDELSYRLTECREHPVMDYVRKLPFETPLYPANMYHGFVNDDSRINDMIMFGQQDLESYCKDREYIPCEETQEGSHKVILMDGSMFTGPFDEDDQEPNVILTKEQTEDIVDSFRGRHLITWNPPAHDYNRAKLRRCGFIRAPDTKGDMGLLHVACSGDKEHYARAKADHCWSLSCPVCCNDTALRMGSRVEDQLLYYKTLTEKQGGDPGQLGHWMISPPQEDMKRWMQTEEDYNRVRKHIVRQLQDVGALAGVLLFHPWRQKSRYWKLAPHFHSLLYGFLDTDTFRANNPGWILKKLHPEQEVESIAHSVSYIATHMGLGMVERHPEDIDWNGKFMEYMFPGMSDDTDRSKGTVIIDGFDIKRDAFRWTDDDRSKQLEGKGRMCGDLSDMDWDEWVKGKMSKTFRILYFGDANQNKISTVTVEKESRTRYCTKCGSPLNVYNGLCDSRGEHSQFVFNNQVRTFRRDASYAKQQFDRLKKALRANGTSLGKLAPSTALLVTTDEIRPHPEFMNNDDGSIGIRAVTSNVDAEQSE